MNQNKAGEQLPEFDIARYHSLNYQRAQEKFFNHVRPMTNQTLVLKMTEELGEIAGCINKLARGKNPKINIDKFETMEAYEDAQLEYLEKQKVNFSKEIAQLNMLISQLATLNGLNLEEITRKEFNEVSEQIGFNYTV